MNVRPFDWRDLPTLHRFQKDCMFLDSALVLTRGPHLVPGALFSYLAPEMGVFTCVTSGSGVGRVIGQFMHISGSPFSHLTFFAPQTRLNRTNISTLIDYMLLMLGGRGALRLVADVDEGSSAFESLRCSGFGIYTRQRIWQLTLSSQEEAHDKSWRASNGRDENAIRSLYNNLVPALVQQVEAQSAQHPKGMVYYENGELAGYVELKYGHRGVWVQPFVHPDAEDVAGRFFELLGRIPNRRSRPVYICVRSYQAWLEAAIEDLGAEAGPRQVVMARQLALPQKARGVFAIPALEGGQPEVTAPVARLESK